MNYDYKTAIDNSLSINPHKDSNNKYHSLPVDARTIIQNISDITNPTQVSNPYVGLIVYCINTDEYYKVTLVTEPTNPLSDPIKVSAYEKLETGNTFETLNVTTSISTPTINVNTINPYSGNNTYVTGTLNTKNVNADGNIVISNEIKSKNASLNYDEIDLSGTGWGIKNDGAACLDSLTLRTFLMVPELKYNRITVLSGITWLAPGAGKIKSVTTKTSGKGTITLELEDGENGSFVLGDWCLGIYHFDSGNSGSTTDSANDGILIKGFTTVYFYVTGVTGTNNQTVEYQLYNKSGQPITSGKHPTAYMAIVGFGNSVDTTRQHCLYQTTKYMKYITGVNSIPSLWDTSKLAMQLGDLSGLTISGVDMSGYSAYLDNVYMKGIIKQIDEHTGDVKEEISYKGTWSSSVKYYKNDMVLYNDYLWVAMSDNIPIGSTPTINEWTQVTKQGPSGITYYTWIQYAYNTTGSGMSSDPTGRDYIGFAYNKTTPIPSTDYRNYTWSKFKGEAGSGDDGRSIVNATLQWALNSSNSTPPSDSSPAWGNYYPSWTFGNYIWTRIKIEYLESDGVTHTYSYTGHRCLTNILGLSNSLLRGRGEYSPTEIYYDNETYQDWVLYNGSTYLCIKTTTAGILPTNTTYFMEFNDMKPIATSVILANKGYVDVLGAGSMFIGQNDTGVDKTKDDATRYTNANGWVVTNGAITHTATGLSLTSDGKLYDPDGISIKVGNVYAGNNANLLFDPYFNANDQGWVKTTSSGLVSQYVSTNYSWPFDGNKLHGDRCLLIIPGNTTSSQILSNATLKRVQLKPNTTYTFSINEWHPDTVSMHCTITFWDSETEGSTTDTVKTFTLTSSSSPKISSYTFSTNGMSKLWCAFRFGYQLESTTTNKTCYIDAVKLEASDVPTEMNDKIAPGVTDDELLETGIDIANRKITITSDNFVVRNNHGDNTFYVNQNGDITYSGTIFHSMNEIDFNNEQSKSKYLIQEAKTNKPISPSEGPSSTWWCFDALSHDGTYIIKNAATNQKIYLPYCLEISQSGSRVVHFTLTQTIANGSQQHYISMDELKTLVGKKLTFINNSGNDIYINIGTKCTAADRVSVDNKIIYQFDDNFYSSMCPDVNDSYELGGATYYSGNIKVLNGYILKLEFVVENIKSSINDNTDPMAAGYIWRYNLLPDSITWETEDDI